MGDKPQTDNSISRRSFIVRIGATGLAVAGGAAATVALHNPDHVVPGISDKVESLPRLRTFNVEPGATDVQMSISHGEDIDKMVRAAVESLGGTEGIGKFIKKGDKVIIKPNVAFDRPPKLGATTSPEVLKAVALMVRDAGASEIRILDNPINQPEGCFVKSGISAAVAELEGQMKVNLILPSPSQFETIHVGGPVLDNWPMFLKPFLDADKVIGIAPLKDHNLCHASMTIKNWYGLLGGRRNQFHQNIYGIVADLAFMMKPTFVILDATRILMRNGPTGGSPSDVKPGNTVVAGIDPVAVDSYGCEILLERDTALVQYLQGAHDRGIGRMDWRALNYREETV
jgi:uncharacterized protein (DUF362 family)